MKNIISFAGLTQVFAFLFVSPAIALFVPIGTTLWFSLIEIIAGLVVAALMVNKARKVQPISAYHGSRSVPKFNF